MDTEKIDLVAEIEKRKKQQQLEENRIFTCLANQARLDSIAGIKKHRDDHKSPLTFNAKPKYLAKVESDNGIVRELEDILNRANLGRSTSAEALSRTITQEDIRTRQSLLRNSSADSIASKAQKKRKPKLPSIKKRYGNITESWVKGPIDIPKDRYFDLNDTRIYGDTKDPRARMLRQQTKCLMNSMQIMSRHSRVNETVRKRVVEKSRVTGEDHVMESLDQYVSTSLNEPGQGRALFQAAVLKLVYPERKACRKPNSRINEAWKCLKAPPACKIWFKLLSEGKLEDLSVESGRMEDAIYESGTLITQMEQLCDFSHVIDLLHILLLMWAEDENLPQMFTSNELLQPLSDKLRSVGLTRIAKSSSEEMTAWLLKVINMVWDLALDKLNFWKSVCDCSSDRHFYSFFVRTEDTLYKMVHCLEIRNAEIEAAEEEARLKAEQEAADAEAAEAARAEEEEDEDGYSEFTYAVWNGLGGEEATGTNVSSHSKHKRRGSVGEKKSKKRGGVLRDDEDEVSRAVGGNEKEGSKQSEDRLSKDVQSTNDGSVKSKDRVKDRNSGGPLVVLVNEKESDEAVEKKPTLPIPIVCSHPQKNAKSTKALKKLQVVEEVMDIGQLLQYHSQKPNKTLIRRLSSLQQENSYPVTEE